MFKNRSAKYYQKSKKKLQNKVREMYQNLSKEERKKKRQYGRKRYKNLPEDEKLVQYRQEYYKIWKNKNASQIKTY